MKKNISAKFIAMLLAVIMLLSTFSYAVFSYGTDGKEKNEEASSLPLDNAASTTDTDTLKISLDGELISDKAISSTDKFVFLAVGVSHAESYQWQIMDPSENAWINIADKIEQSCEVSKALIRSMLEEDDYTALRCTAKNADTLYISDPVVVVLYENVEIETEEENKVIPRTSFAATPYAEGEPEAFSDGDTDEVPEFVHVTIEYKLEGFDEYLFPSYNATLQYGASLSSKVPSPTFIGYEPFIKDTTVDAKLVELSYANITEDKTTVVVYRPGKVTYRVKYYLQNITDDNYIEDFSLSFEGSAYTGTYPQSEVEKEIDGFTSLYHIPADVAADGSTVFECYYDRNYYLYSFDCNGGYGTDSVYARYGTHLVVPRPVRAGYVFAGWDEQTLDLETGTYSGDGSVDELPTSIGGANKSYLAVWEPVLTTVKIVYWNENPDDDGYNYWDSRIIHTMSGTEIKAGDILEPCRMHNTVTGSDDPAYTVEADSHTKEGHEAELLKDATYHNYWASRGDAEGESWFTITAHDVDHPTLDCIALDLSDAYTDMDAERLKVDIDVDVTYANGTVLHKSFEDICLSEGFTLNNQTEQTSTIESIKFTFKNRQRLEHGVWVADGFEFRCAEVEIFSGTSVPISVIPNTDTVSSNEFDQYLLNDERTTQIAEGMYNNAEKTAIIVEGDGSTVINVYYKRQKYHFRMIYAMKKSDGTWQLPAYTQEWAGLQDDILTNHTGKAVTQDFTYNLSTQLNKASWTNIEENVQPSLIDPSKYEIEEFEIGGNTYCALNFTVKYGQSLKDIYPLNVFNPIKSPNSPWGDYIVHSSWTGECYVRYSYKANAYGGTTQYIRTIKGKFIRAEGDMLYEDGTPFTDGRKYVDGKYETWTYSADYTHRYQTDESGNRIINYLAYWANTNTSDKNIRNWNIPVQWQYNTYLEALPEVVETLPACNTGSGGKDWSKVSEYLDGTIYDSGWEYTADDGTVYRYIHHGDDNTWNYYVLYDRYYAYDNNIGSTGFANQTATETKGYTLRRRRYAGTFNVDYSFETMLKIKATSHNTGAVPGYFTSNGVTTDGMTGCIGNFYYNRDDYELRLYNQGEYLTDTSGTTQSPLVPYEENLNNAIEDYFGLSSLDQYAPAYPGSLEAGAYEFGGWYTSPLFFEGTEVTDLSVMKATPMTLYAEWAPIKHTVNFYNSYNDLISGGAKLEGPLNISHGDYIPTSKIPDPKEELFGGDSRYLFIGWFYFNGAGEKTAYDPGSIPVLTDLDLFAEWYSSLSVGYTLHYVEYKNAENKVADDTNGMTYAGITRTFDAKPYTELYGGGIVDGLRYYPLSNSSSIIVSENANDNEITFEYGKRASVDYIVKYVDSSTGEVITVDGNDNPVEGTSVDFSTNVTTPLTDDGGNPVYGIKKVVGCTDAVVTEKYKFISGYLPDYFYKERILTYYDNDAEGGEIENENEIIFYYTKDSTHRKYAVRYWRQNLKEDPSDETTYSLDHTIEGIGNIDQEIIADITGIRGFSFNEELTSTKNPGVTIDTVHNQVSAKLSGDAENDLIIDLYFDRIVCNYIVRFVVYGDTENTDNKLHNDIVLTGSYGETAQFDVNSACQLVEHDPKSAHTDDNNFKAIKYDGVEYKWKDIGSVDGVYTISFTESQIVGEEEKWPVLLLYYTTETVEIFYIPVTRYPGLGTCTTSPYRETWNPLSNPKSVATADDYYEFKGWYTDKDCNDKDKITDPEIVNENVITPKITGSEKIVYYYALFEPKTTDLTIEKKVVNAENEELSVEDTFIFTVKGVPGTASEIVDLTVAITGSGTLTIDNVPYGEYTVTETAWSWRYKLKDGGEYAKTINVSTPREEPKVARTVTFTNTPTGSAWLGAESHADNDLIYQP